jgi:hypothetical protein
MLVFIGCVALMVLLHSPVGKEGPVVRWELVNLAGSFPGSGTIGGMRRGNWRRSASVTMGTGEGVERKCID